MDEKKMGIKDIAVMKNLMLMSTGSKEFTKTSKLPMAKPTPTVEIGSVDLLTIAITLITRGELKIPIVDNMIG